MDGPASAIRGDDINLDVHYDIGDATPWSAVGCPISTWSPDGPLRSYLAAARCPPVLLSLGEPGGMRSPRGRIGSSDRRNVHRSMGLPAIGEFRPPLPC